MHGGDRVYIGDRVYSRAPADRVHRAHNVDATDAFMLCGAAMAFVCCSLAWWLCSLCVALCERNRRNRRRQCLFDLCDEELFAARSPHTRGARDFSPPRWREADAWCEARDDDDNAYSEYAQ
jgi:hypothetical protein